jgi:hypothetical protein
MQTRSLQENGAVGFTNEWRKVTDVTEEEKEKIKVVPCDEETATNLIALVKEVNKNELPRRGGGTD